jgi:hypothetical protein
MRAQMQAQMLGQLGQMATMPESLYMGFEPAAIQKMIGYTTGGLGPTMPAGMFALQGAMSGMFGGAQLGASMGGGRPNLDQSAAGLQALYGPQGYMGV